MSLVLGGYFQMIIHTPTFEDFRFVCEYINSIKTTHDYYYVIPLDFQSWNIFEKRTCVKLTDTSITFDSRGYYNTIGAHILSVKEFKKLIHIPKYKTILKEFV